MTEKWGPAAEARVNGLPPTGSRAFDGWLESRGDVRDKLTEKGGTLYRSIWTRWLAFLMVDRIDAENLPLLAVPWYLAKPKHVLKFIHSDLQPSKPGRPVSEISRRRYWTALERIYAYAVSRQWVLDNPARDIFASQVPPSEDPKGAILDGATWSAALTCFPQGDALMDLRNRAILSLLFHLGLSPLEVRSLTVNDLIYSTPQGEQITALSIKGPGVNQNRTMALPKPAADALAVWLAAHQAHPEAKTYPKVFFSRESGEISPHTLLKLVKDCLAKACDTHGLKQPVRMGPQVVRNTLLVQWLRHRSIAEVVRDAGLKNAHGLLHLVDLLPPELGQDLRAAVAACRAAERQSAAQAGAI